MISDKLYSADKTLELEEELKNNNYVIWKCNGVSMLPFIKAESDILILETIKSEPKPYDVLMYLMVNLLMPILLDRIFNNWT